jgi:hypothetical protein
MSDRLLDLIAPRNNPQGGLPVELRQMIREAHRRLYDRLNTHEIVHAHIDQLAELFQERMDLNERVYNGPMDEAPVPDYPDWRRAMRLTRHTDNGPVTRSTWTMRRPLVIGPRPHGPRRARLFRNNVFTPFVEW